MITDIRKSLQSRGIKLILWLTLASLMAGTISFFVRLPGSSLEDSIALVNGYSISVPEFRRKYTELQNMMRDITQVYGNQAPLVLKMWGFDRPASEIVLDELIGEKVMKSASDTLGTHVHQQHIQNKLRDPYFVRQYLAGLISPQAMRGGTLDIEALNYDLQRQGITEEEFDQALEDAISRAFFFHLVEGGLYIPETLLKDAYIGKYLKKKYEFSVLPKAQYLSKVRAQKITQAELEKYYSDHKENYRVPEKRSAKIWIFSPENFLLAVKDDEIKAAYERNKREFIKKPAEVDVQHILFTYTDATKLSVRTASQEVLKEVKANPSKFSEIAAKQSQSKDKGSTITLTRADKNRAFTNAAFDLKKDEIAGVIETQDGFEIIKLLDKKQPVFKPLDDVKTEIAKKLSQEKFERTFATQAQRVVTQSRDVPTVFSLFVTEHKGQESSVTDIGSSEKMPNNRIFGLRKVGDKGFYSEGTKGYLVEVTAITPTAIPPLASIQPKVEQDCYEERAQNLLKKDLDTAVSDIRSGKKTFAQVAQGFGVPVETTSWVNFEDRESFKKLQDLKFNLPEIAQLTHQGAVVEGITQTSGYLIAIKELEPFKEESFEAKKVSLRAEVGGQYRQNATGSLVQTLRSKADVQINKNLLSQASR